MPISSLNSDDRLRAIELLLLWEGSLTSARLRSLFPVHATQASRDIAAYRAIAPDNIAKTWGAKAYEPGPFAKAVLTDGRFAEYAQLIGAAGPLRASTVVPLETMSPLHMDIEAACFRVLHRAVADRMGVTIRYASMTNPNPHARSVVPHAFIRAGTRWHMRAWCALRSDYRDFNLARIGGALPAPDLPLPPKPDIAWTTPVELRMVPHQALSKAQATIVRNEFCGGASAIRVDSTEALVRYALLAYPVTSMPERDGPPKFLLQLDRRFALPDGAPTAV
jgi:predicted DNA-binding transcriptional regulator YafY